MDISVKKFFCGRGLGIACLMLSSFAMGACNDAAGKKGQADSGEESRPDAAITKMMRAISDGNAEGFAAICVYPVQRPYPLKDIDDATAMADYFPVLMDDSIRDVMKHRKPADWERFGWRGWSFGDDTPIWYDDGVQGIDYVSKAERGLIRILSREELMTLSPEYRDGWTPVATLIGIDHGNVYRIDSKGDVYRLMGFDSPDNVGGVPSLIMSGSLDLEGSADSRVYVFSDSIGGKIEYLPDGEPPVRIFISRPGSEEESENVRPGYWRDVVHPKP